MASSRQVAQAIVWTTTRRRIFARPLPAISRSQTFASTSRVGAAEQEDKDAAERARQKRKEESKRREEEAGPAPGVTPWARFMEVLKSEYEKSKEFQGNVKELSGKTEGIKNSEAAQRMRQAYTAMQLQRLIENNPRLGAMASHLSKTGRSVSDIVNRTAQEIEDSALMQAAKRAAASVDEAMEPIRQTEVYKAVEDTVDFSQGALRYGGYVEREERMRRRQKRLERLGRAAKGMGVLGGPGSRAHREAMEKAEAAGVATPGAAAGSGASSPGLDSERDIGDSAPSRFSNFSTPPEPGIAANPNAAPALVLHATANTESSAPRSRFLSLAPEPIRQALSSLHASYQESDNPFVASLRSVTGAVGRFFDETEMAKVARWIKEMDPEFEIDGFLRDLREYVVPEIVDAYVAADMKTLKMWTSEGAFNVITAPMQHYLSRGLRPESQVIDLKGIDIMSAKILEERDIPVFVVSFRTHEITAFSNPKGEIEVGNADQIDQVQYVMVITRQAESCGDEVTGGWTIIDMARRGTAVFL